MRVALNDVEYCLGPRSLAIQGAWSGPLLTVAMLQGLQVKVLWMDETLHHLGNYETPLFVGIYRRINIAVFLRWWRVSSIHSMDAVDSTMLSSEYTCRYAQGRYVHIGGTAFAFGGLHTHPYLQPPPPPPRLDALWQSSRPSH